MELYRIYWKIYYQYFNVDILLYHRKVAFEDAIALNNIKLN